ncbi:MAG: glycoside hydrolase family 2 TIM barrel-domain containing protein [Pseudomonadota bacterium]|nr:glycoside hydrolase family 2 TIM barrel-domain containing protein [Pseudomonadota bacterium]
MLVQIQSFLVVLGIAVALTGCTGLQPLSKHHEPSQDLGGSWLAHPDPSGSADFSAVEIDDSHWQKVPVPANWYLQGYDLSGVVWYRHHFTVSESLKDKRVRVHFQGVDYLSKVWLNGHYLGEHEGYFQPFEFEVTEYLEPDGENLLVVRVDSPLEEHGPDWSLHKRWIKGIFGHHDTRPGGAWSDRGQEKNTGGIWAPVYLHSSDRVMIDSVHITPQVDPSTKRASAVVNVKLDYAGARPDSFLVSTGLTPPNFLGASETEAQQRVILKPGTNQLSLFVPEDAYRLWTIWERGDPNLYRYTILVRDSAGMNLAKEDFLFGFRSIERGKTNGEWLLNGKRLFLRGTNYIGTQWMSEMSPRRYARDIELMKEANINIVRVHAHIASRDFYRQCDEAGMLVWQDFPLQWGYQDTPEFAAEAGRQVGDMVETLYNHPSIVAWSLHNEPPWDAVWMKWKYSGYNPEQNRELDEGLFDILKTYRDGRYKHLTSSTLEHPWLGWYSGHWLDYGKPTAQSLITEFGAQALPSLKSLRKIFSDEEMWPDNEQEWAKWNYHNFQRKETFEIAKVPMGESIDEFIHNTQQYQARLTQFAAESYRRQRYAPVVGAFQFMFVENWPSLNWGIVDYWRNPKPGFHALKIAYQPVLPSIEWSTDEFSVDEPVELGLWVINDLFRDFPDATLHYELVQDGKQILRRSLTLDIGADSGREVETVQMPGLAPGNYQLKTHITDHLGRSRGTNSFRFDVKDATNAQP